MNRRELLMKTLVSTAGLAALPRVSLARQCLKSTTPAQTEGPFYSVADQIDKDADLVVVQGSPEIAAGEIVIVKGKLTDQYCKPAKGALVEIWQACHTGRYNHPSDPNTIAALDPHFQYWGKAVTDQNGFYQFRTIIPGSYPADTNWERPPHIHFKISKLGYIELITQMYFKGEWLNEKDLILQRLSKADQEKVIVSFKSVADSPHPTGTFDIQIEKI